METNIIKIGNSKGLRLSKTLLKKYKIKDKVQIELHDEGILIKPFSSPRAGWNELFKRMRRDGDDDLLIPDIFEDEIID